MAIGELSETKLKPVESCTTIRRAFSLGWDDWTRSMTELSEGDRAIIREITFEVWKLVLSQHIQTCPYGQKMKNVKWVLVGVALGFGASGLGGGYAIAKLLAMV